jgi:arylsulfatase A-like enzyme
VGRPAPIILTKLDRVLDKLGSGRPLFLFAHFCDPHEPYDAHGTVSHTATISLDGEELATVTTSEMSNWGYDTVLAPGKHLIEVRGSSSFSMRRFIAQGQGLKNDWDSAAQPDMQLLRTISVENTKDEPTEAHLALWINDAIDNQEVVRRYLLEVEFVDRYVGRLLDDLREKGLYDNSIVILTADHGESLGDHGNLGHVRNLYDELIRVPLVIKLPKGDPRQAELESRRSNLVSHMDLAPTVLDLLGLPGLAEQKGLSILASAPLDQERTVISETHKPESNRNLVGIRDLRYKLILNPDSMEWEMYDLREDPGELRNVYPSDAGERPEWVNLLLRIAGASAGLERSELDAETKATLEALGY